MFATLLINLYLNLTFQYPLQSEFSAMVSMLDGVILYTTPNIKDVLGYPRDMWMGRSFIDLVHPEDRSTFASYITSWVALPHEQNKCEIYILV